MMRQGRLCEWIDGIIRLHNEEQEEKTLWEVWLHKVFDKGFTEWRESLTTKAFGSPKREDLTKAVRESRGILRGFVPDGGAEDGRRADAGD